MSSERRRSSAFSVFSTADSGISVSSVFPPHVSDISSEVFVSKASGNGYPIVQSNGCKKFGPPLNYQGEEPSSQCELYIKDFPKDYLEHHLIPHFERFGEIYDFRLMMDYDNNNRGYAYIRFMKEESASAALEVMKYFFLPNGSTLQVHKSYNKCRLFVSNLPREVPQEKIKEVFHHLFPKLISMTIHVTEQKNRAFAFLDFADHKAALEVKMQTSPGFLDLFDREVKIMWAFPERQMQTPSEISNKTLFIRNIGLTVNVSDIKTFLTKTVPLKSIKNISPVRDFAFVDFADHVSAKKVKDQCNGKVISMTPIEIEYARPPSEESIHKIKQTDFDHKLRLKCIANYWEVPIFLYGRVYQELKIQYVCVLIKTRVSVHYYFFEVSYVDLVDIQGRVAEVINHLIEMFKQLPDENLVIKVERELYAVVGFFKNMKIAPMFIPSVKYPELKILFEELLDLALMASTIGSCDLDYLYLEYQHYLTKPGAFMENLIVNRRVLACINPKIRHSTETFPPGLKNLDMMFALCCAYLYNNVHFFNKLPNHYPLKFFFKNGVIQNHHYIVSPHLLPLNFVQSKRKSDQTCGHIIHGNIKMPSQYGHFQPQFHDPWFCLPPPPPRFNPIYAPVPLSSTPSLMISTIPNQMGATVKRNNSNVF